MAGHPTSKTSARTTDFLIICLYSQLVSGQL
jgi:hypothetical protein